MAEQVQHFVFVCRGKINGENCRTPIMLPDDAFERQFPDRAVRPSDDYPVALLCWRCKRVDIFSPLQNSPYYDPDSHNIECFPTGDTEFLLPLQIGRAS